MTSRVSYGSCKDCGSPYALTATARRLDVARGLSEPERCPRCRKTNAAAIRSRGAAYWSPPLELDESKHDYSKRGLFKLLRPLPTRTDLPDNSVPPDLPLRYLAEEKRLGRDDHPELARLFGADLALARKFSTIAPVAHQIIGNLTDPNGTRVSVLVGPTGTGKSTWVPYAILRSRVGEQGRICVTQPRTITLKQAEGKGDDTSTPGYIARHLLRAVLPDGSAGVGPGHEVGLQYSGTYDMQDRYTKLLFVTDGTLVRWLETGRVGEFDVVFVDEAHEQSTNMELIFALLRYRLPLFPRLRVVIASATADTDKFRRYFGNGNPAAVFLAAPAQARTGTLYPIHDRFLGEWKCPGLPDLTVKDPIARGRAVPAAAAAVVRAIRTDAAFPKLGAPDGDVLVFAPTAELVRQTAEAVRKLGLKQDVVVTHAKSTGAELAAFKKSESRAEKAAAEGRPTAPPRVIVATNYAETSVTISNLKYVIDGGLILEPQWDPGTCSNQFDPWWHSRAGCKQRVGRVGRTQPGEAFRLYTAAEHATFPEHTTPEVARQPLDQFLLSAKAAGIENLDSFEWLGRQAAGGEYARSVAALGRRATFDADGDITRRGLELNGLRTDRVELAECLAQADSSACAVEVATFLAFGDRPGGVFPRDEAGLVAFGRWRQGCADDLEFYLRLFQRWYAQPKGRRDAWAAAHALDGAALAEVGRARTDLLREFTRRGHGDPADRALDLARLHRTRLVLAKALREWVYVRRAGGEFVPFDPAECPYAGPVELDRDSACAGTDAGAVVCVERSRSRAGRVFARHLVRVETDWLPHLRTAGPLALALLLRRTHQADAAAAARAVKVVPSDPLPTPAGFVRDTLLDRLRVLRHERDDGGEMLLTADEATGFPVLVGKGTDDRVAVGEVLRAVVREADRVRGRVVADQSAVVASYGTIVGNADHAVAGEVTGLADGGKVALVRLEPGVRGRLDRRDVGPATRRAFAELAPGTRLHVCVTAVTGRDIDLAEPGVVVARRRKVTIGERFPTATVVMFEERDGRRTGAVVELYPDRLAWLARGQLGAGRSEGRQQAELNALTIGSRVSVAVDRFEQGEVWVRAVYRSASDVRPGVTFDGLVVGFLMQERDRTGAFVELVPGRDGLLHINSPGVRPVIGTWAVGTPLRVVVDGVDGDRCRLRLA